MQKDGKAFLYACDSKTALFHSGLRNTKSGINGGILIVFLSHDDNATVVFCSKYRWIIFGKIQRCS